MDRRINHPMRTKVGDGEQGINEMYAHYTATVKNPIEYKLYKEIVHEYLKKLMEAVIQDGEVVNLPNGMGKLFIKKKKTNFKKPSPDWGTYRKEGVKAVHTNDHSDGYRVRFHWEKKSARLGTNTRLHIRPYSFTAARDMKRGLATVMKTPNGHTRYLEYIYQ